MPKREGVWDEFEEEPEGSGSGGGGQPAGSEGEEEELQMSMSAGEGGEREQNVPARENLQVDHEGAAAETEHTGASAESEHGGASAESEFEEESGGPSKGGSAAGSGAESAGSSSGGSSETESSSSRGTEEEEGVIRQNSTVYKLDEGVPVLPGNKYKFIVDPPGKAWLSVQIFFHGSPMEETEVEFFEDSGDGSRGSGVGEKLKTDEDGIAYLEERVEIGNYVCVIEGQPDAPVTTTGDFKDPVKIPLPFGRPAFEAAGIGEGEEGIENEIA